MGRGKDLMLAQKKYGMKNFKKDILVYNISTQEQTNLLEKTFIAAEREKVGRENCYNKADGGLGGSYGMKDHHHSEETKQKLKTSVYNGKKPKGFHQREIKDDRANKISNTLKKQRAVYMQFTDTGEVLTTNECAKIYGYAGSSCVGRSIRRGGFVAGRPAILITNKIVVKHS
jgi:hypothetical protein